MESNKITQILTNSNCGLAGMHDVYITISKRRNPEEIFGVPPKEIMFIDIKTGNVIELRFKHEKNGEYRLSRLGSYLRLKKAKPGNEIVLGWTDSERSGNRLFYIDINKLK